MTYLGSKNKKEVIAAEARICANCGIPDGEGTYRWSDVNQDLNGVWYTSSPTEGGWNGFTYEQMMQGVTLKEVEVFTNGDGD